MVWGGKKKQLASKSKDNECKEAKDENKLDVNHCWEGGRAEEFRHESTSGRRRGLNISERFIVNDFLVWRRFHFVN